jgi:site-specific recombinase
MLGMVPPIGQFFGIPLDVRHVTLTTGTWALAAASLRLGAFQRHRFYRAIPGIAVMFVFNLTVSFSISLLVALRAYDIPVKEHIRLLRTVLGRFVKRPGEFLLAPRATIEDGSQPHP